MRIKGNRIIGIRNMQVEHAVGEATKINLELVATPGYNPHNILDEDFDMLMPGKVIVKCGFCGQWAARKTECGRCGAPVE